MFTVFIYFVGFISHLTYASGNEPTRHVAALVYQSLHSPELIIPAGSILPSRKEFTRIRVDGNGLAHFSLDGVGVIRILGLSADDMQSSTPAFQADLLGLEKGTGSTTTLKPEVMNEQDVDGSGARITWAYLELQGGQLGIAGYYSKMGSYAGGNFVCVPSEIVYRGTSAGSVIEFVSSKGDYDMRVAAGAPIIVANLPASGQVGHFKEFGKLLLNDPPAGDWRIGDACTVKGPIFDPGPLGKGDSVDCTNTHFP